jgi:hypothetical protein
MKRHNLSVGQRRVIVVLAGCCALVSLAIRSVLQPGSAKTWDTILWIFEGIMLITVLVFTMALSGGHQRRDID